MKKIGKQVYFLPTGDSVKRAGEGAFARLADGRLMYAYTEYVGAGNEDADPARLSAVFSSDEGETWGGHRVLMTCRPEDRNIMSISFMRMLDGQLGMFFLRKTGEACVLNLVRSADEGETWGEPTICTDNKYYVVNNDRVIRLKNGNLMFPANMHASPTSDISLQYYFCSEDDGKTWKKLNEEPIKHPFPTTTTGLQEGGIYELFNGAIWGWARTRSGSQFSMYSKDGGASWTPPVDSELFTSPDAPMQVKDVGPYTVAIFNPKPRYYARVEHEAPETGKGLWARTPFICLVSQDRGKTFPEGYYLETDPSNSYCYPAVFAGEDYFLVAYYHSNGSGQCLSSGKILKVSFSELEGGYRTLAKAAKSYAAQVALSE